MRERRAGDAKWLILLIGLLRVMVVQWWRSSACTDDFGLRFLPHSTASHTSTGDLWKQIMAKNAFSDGWTFASLSLADSEFRRFLLRCLSLFVWIIHPLSKVIIKGLLSNILHAIRRCWPLLLLQSVLWVTSTERIRSQAAIDIRRRCRVGGHAKGHASGSNREFTLMWSNDQEQGGD